MTHQDTILKQLLVNGPQTQKQLIQHLGIRKQNFYRLIKRLEAQDLIYREPIKSDRGRQYCIYLKFGIDY